MRLIDLLIVAGERFDRLPERTQHVVLALVFAACFIVMGVVEASTPELPPY